MMELGKTTGAVGEEVVHRHFQTLLAVLKLTQQFQLVAAHHFRCCGRRWRTQIRHKIRDGDVRFMPDGTHHRDNAGKDRPRHTFVVKAPQVFQRAAATSDDQHIALLTRIRQFNGADNLARCIVTLYRGWVDDHGQGRVTTLKHVQDIVQGRTGF